MKNAIIPGLLAAILCASLACSERADDSTETGSSTVESADPADARAIHARALVLDAHADIEIPGQEDRYVGPDGLSKVAPEKMRAGGVDAVVMAVAASPGPRTEAGYAAARAKADAELAAVVAITRDPANNLILARSAEDLVEAHDQGIGALMLGFQNALSLGRDVSVLDELYSAGVRVFALTHMGHNDFADSSRPLYIKAIDAHEPEEEHGGLSELGVQAIQRINALGGLVDVSQLSKAATMQVLELSSAPVIASHSNVRRLTDVSRNLSDEEIDAIGAKGGVIHVAPFKAYLYDSSDEVLTQEIREVRKTAGIREDYYYPFELYWEITDPAVQMTFIESMSSLLDSVGLDEMLDHLEYIEQRIGVDHVGIGTDFNHGSGIEGFQDASEALHVTEALIDRGFSVEEIEKIWGGNFLRVLAAAESRAGSSD